MRKMKKQFKLVYSYEEDLHPIKLPDGSVILGQCEFIEIFTDAPEDAEVHFTKYGRMKSRRGGRLTLNRIAHAIQLQVLDTPNPYLKELAKMLKYFHRRGYYHDLRDNDITDHEDCVEVATTFSMYRIKEEIRYHKGRGYSVVRKPKPGLLKL